MKGLKGILDRFYLEYDFAGRIKHDPIRFPHRYKDPLDIEIAGFLASSFAYGRVGLFSAVVEKILGVMGTSPYAFMLGFDIERHRKLFAGIKYRFNENDDVLCLLYLLNTMLRDYASIEKAFKSFCPAENPDVGNALSGLVNTFLRTDTSPVYGKDLKPAGLLQFFPSPENGSACKRANLFLRWMIRDRDIDFGIWKGIPKSKLVIPLDTHIARIARCLGLTYRKTQDWKMAVEITQSMKKFDPEDPLKYDFALCHHGISGMCSGKKGSETCKECVLRKR